MLHSEWISSRKRDTRRSLESKTDMRTTFGGTKRCVYICFLDYEKAFDRVRYEPLIQCLREIGVDGKYTKIIRNLYWDHTASVRIMNELSDEIRMQRGVRQGCVASPNIFNLYTDNIFRDIINTKGVKVGGKHYNNPRYADDTALLSGNEKELTELTRKINEVGKQVGMKINIKKTKVMVVSNKRNSPKINIAINGQHLEQVTSYMYLGSLITEDGRGEKEIKRRIMIARTTFTIMITLLSRRGINLKTRLRAIKCYIWPTLFYGAETWTITKYMFSRLDAFEMWVSQSIENMMDGKYYKRGSIEKDEDRPRNSETIQDQETTISRTSYNA